MRAAPPLLALATCAACSTWIPAQPITDSERAQTLLPWLDAQTTKATALAELGTPTLTLEDGNVLCYLLLFDDEDYSVAVSPMWGTDAYFDRFYWAPVDCDLLLIFDDTGQLRDYTLRKLHYPVFVGSPFSKAGITPLPRDRAGVSMYEWAPLHHTGPVILPEQAERIRPGTTTRHEVLVELGHPYSEADLGGVPSLIYVWSWMRPGSSYLHDMFVVTFADDGRVRRLGFLTAGAGGVPTRAALQERAAAWYAEMELVDALQQSGHEALRP